MITSKVEIISTEQKYNIQFAIPFFICIGIMVFEKIYLLLGYLPALFTGADILYQAIAHILSIITQLAASVAAAIIFYYCTELLSKKKDMEKYVDMRREMLITMYFFMDCLEQFEHFSPIKCSNTNKRGHDVNDVEPFCACLRRLDNDTYYSLLIAQIKEYIKNNIDEFESYLRVLRSSSTGVYENTKQYRFFRNSLDNADVLKNVFEDLDAIFFVYKDNIGNGEIDEEKAVNEISEYFIYFIKCYVDYEMKLGTIMTAINRKQFLTFMRLLD